MKININDLPETKNTIYLQRYVDFINSREIRNLNREIGYEIHHIIPRCLDGSNDCDNLIKLSYEEHYIAHFLLWKIGYKGMTYAFNCMCTYSNFNSKRSFKLNAKDFALFKLEYASKVKNSSSSKGKIRINDGSKNEFVNSVDEIPIGWKRGIYMSEESYLKIKNKRDICITNGKIDRRIFLNESIPDGWWLGSYQKGKTNQYYWVNNGIKNVYMNQKDAIPEGFTVGKLFSEEEREKLKTNLGKVWITDGIKNKLINKNDLIPDGFHLGSVHNFNYKITKEHKEKISKANSKYFWITDGVKNLRCCDESNIQTGWYKGLTLTEEQKEKLAKSRKNKVFINNGFESKLINVGEKIPNGWVDGKITDKKFKATNGTEFKNFKIDQLPNDWLFCDFLEKNKIEKIWINNGEKNIESYVCFDLKEGWQYGKKQKKQYDKSNLKYGKNHPRSVEIKCIETDENFSCVREASEKMNGLISHAGIAKSLKTKKSCNGYTFIRV